MMDVSGGGGGGDGNNSSSLPQPSRVDGYGRAGFGHAGGMNL